MTERSADVRVVVSQNRRFLQYEDGTPFFWLGDTGWLLLTRLSKPEALVYLDDRRSKGFNVVQAMLVHSLPGSNVYGETPFEDADPGRPKVTGGHDYWDHVEWVIDRAKERGIYMALVCCWGSVVKSGRLSPEQARRYGLFLGERFREKPNIFWLTGGDIYGDQHADVWHALGTALKEADPDHLVTFHPFGRTQSSTWFHDAPWLDFNMFQSGHRRYDQDPDGKGEDNWRYVEEDYSRLPVKPTLDGEPSYEGIPQGLHDPSEPLWTDRDARRYAYWSVFAGSFGHTYGNSAVMQMLKASHKRASYGTKRYWDEAIHDPGAAQMRHLKSLMLSRPFFERVPASEVVVDQGERYDRVIATRGRQYLFAYAYTGRPFEVRLGVIEGERVRAWWYNPRIGLAEEFGVFENSGSRTFAPPGGRAEGNDWVLVLDDEVAGFPPPGAPAV